MSALRRTLLTITILCMASLCRAQVAACSIDDIIKRTSSKDTLYIINFWATWCAPCVAELPEFNRLHEHYAGKPVKLLLVSLDFKEDRTFKLQRFIEKKGLRPEVVWLSDTDPNVFIPKIENNWEGSIPATLIIHPGKRFRKFIEGSTTEAEVSRIANKVLQSN